MNSCQIASQLFKMTTGKINFQQFLTHLKQPNSQVQKHPKQKWKPYLFRNFELKRVMPTKPYVEYSHSNSVKRTTVRKTLPYGTVSILDVL